MTKNYKRALLYFVAKGDIPWDSEQQLYVLHHKDVNLKTNDPTRYSQWNPEDLVVMKRSEHTILHNKGNKYNLGHHHSEETKKKLSDLNKGRKLSQETKNKISKSMKGNKVWNKGLTKYNDEHIKKFADNMMGHTPWNKGKKLKGD